MNLLQLSLRRPLTVLVLVLAVALGAGIALQRMTRDVFPPLGIPTIYVAQPYGGMDPAQMEGYLTYRYEYHFLYITGIEHVESKSIQGASIMKLQFHPGTDISQAMSETVAQVNRSRAFMPPGTVAPFIMRFDAGSVAVGYLVFSTEDPDITLSQMQDQALNRVRPAFATLPGVSAPPPFGGSSRGVIVDVNPDRMRAYGLSPDDIVQALAKGNVVSPSGNMNLGDKYPIVPMNAIVSHVKELEAVPLKRAAAGTVFVRDVATVSDGADVVTSYALANGRRTVYLPVTKRGDASTLEVVALVKKNIPEFQKLLPEGLKVSYEFDQSPVVRRSIRDLLKEGGLGAMLTGLMVLLFLRDWRSAFIVVINIPLALLAAAFALWVSGQNIHLMTLGGMALAVGILVDEATVTVENIHAHLARGESLARAALEGTRETALPRLLAMLCILAVFVPAFFMEGAAKALFVPLALAVGFAMVASFVLSSTLVPILSVWFLRGSESGMHSPRGLRRAPLRSALGPSGTPSIGEGPATAAEAVAFAIHDPSFIAKLQSAYAAALRPAVAARWPLVAVYLMAAGVGLWFIGVRLGTEIFPKTDTGQFALRFRAPSGTRVGLTEHMAQQILATIAREAGGEDRVAMTIGLVGVHNSSYPVNLVHLWNGGPEEGWLAVQLKREAGWRVEDFKEHLRGVLVRELPDVRLSFEPQDIVTRVMSFGSPTPIEVAVSGADLNVSKGHAEKILARLREIPFLRDVQIAQTLDFPTVGVDIHRERAGVLGVKVEDVTRSLVAATTSSRFTVANYWADPKSGISYNLQVQIPETKTQTIEDLKNVPVTAEGGQTVLLRNVANVTPGTAVGTYERYNMDRVVSVTANIHGADLGAATRGVNQALADVGPPPDAKTKVSVRGQVIPYNQLIGGFRIGLLLAVVAIFLMLLANFQSVRLALAVLSTVPAVLVGVVLALELTGTTLNIQSAMGAIMAVGVAVANAILLVTFAEKARSADASPARGDPAAAAVEGACSRLRPILMTSCAMIAGMMPLALGLGEGGDQTAPLGRAVVGGSAMATVATLFVLPSGFAILASRRVRSVSLDPEDPESSYFDGRPGHLKETTAS
ncbi:MAG: efflux RND transporter permease subunit [Verrucomicrobia bacterium]|nr:efflux RND transporter permease subunit [Verrucomicrobiota bacterium]